MLPLLRALRFSVAVALVAVVAVAVPAQRVSAMQPGFAIAAPDAAPPGYNHILCYTIKYGYQPQFGVTLTDQFFTKGFQTTITGPDIACTPAKKTLLYRHPITGFRTNGHYVCYPINNQPQPVNVTTKYGNQLELSSLTWLVPFTLCVPTYKRLVGLDEGAPPKGYTHLMVYYYETVISGIHGVVFKNALPSTTVTVQDQFYPSGFTTTLGNPWMLLTPTKKYYGKPRKVAPNGHWIWYSFSPPYAAQGARRYVNQLEKNSLTAYFPNWLMVPTYKYKP